MSARVRSVAATLAASGLLTAGAVVLPAAVANAATTPARTPSTPLSIVATSPTNAVPSLLRGAGTATVTFTVRNNTRHAVAFSPVILGLPHGVIPIATTQVSRTVQSVHAPKTRLITGGHDGATADRLVPASGKANAEFSIPAKGSYTWKLGYRVDKSFPANDPDLYLDFRALSAPLNTSLAGNGTFVDLGVAVGTSRPFAEFLTGGTTVAPGKPLALDLNMVNYTGAAIRGGFGTQVSAAPIFSGKPPAKQPLLALDEWIGGRWVTLTNEFNENAWTLPTFTGCIANRADHKVALRLRVLHANGIATVDLSALTSLTHGTSARLLSGLQLRPVALAS
jgi:hypothetical protein